MVSERRVSYQLVPSVKSIINCSRVMDFTLREMISMESAWQHCCKAFKIMKRLTKLLEHPDLPELLEPNLSDDSKNAESSLKKKEESEQLNEQVDEDKFMIDHLEGDGVLNHEDFVKNLQDDSLTMHAATKDEELCNRGVITTAFDQISDLSNNATKTCDFQDVSCDDSLITLLMKSILKKHFQMKDLVSSNQLSMIDSFHIPAKSIEMTWGSISKPNLWKLS